MPGESCLKRCCSLFRLCDVFRALITSLCVLVYSGALGLKYSNLTKNGTKNKTQSTGTPPTTPTERWEARAKRYIREQLPNGIYLQVAFSDKDGRRGARLRKPTRLHSSKMCWLMGEVLLYVHRNRRFIRDGSPGRSPRFLHSS